MKKKILMIFTSVLMITLVSAGVAGAQALPGLLLEGEELEATGYIEEYTMDEYIIVDGETYLINSETEIEEGIVLGDFVKVKYYEEEGQFIALEVELEDEEFEITGYVDEYVMDEYIIVDGETYLINSESEIEEGIVVGDFVKVKYYEGEGQFIALEVELEDEEFEVKGYVDEYVPGEYIVVDGVRYEINMDTIVEEDIEVGDFVEVKYYHEDELLIALEVALEDEDDDDMDDDMYDNAVCSGETTHPALQDLATTFSVSYEELLRYFCEQKFGIGEIKHALETAENDDVDMTWQELLDLRHSAGWGEIWQDLGLIGKDKNENGETYEIQEQEQEKQKEKSNNGKSADNPGKGKGKDKNN